VRIALAEDRLSARLVQRTPRARLDVATEGCQTVDDVVRSVARHSQWQVEQDVAAQVEQLLPPPPDDECTAKADSRRDDECTAKADSRRRTFEEPHRGQTTTESPRTSSSNAVPHSSHVYS
jgi:hypothetical protein